jgi:hypothetical protein
MRRSTWCEFWCSPPARRGAPDGASFSAGGARSCAAPAGAWHASARCSIWRLCPGAGRLRPRTGHARVLPDRVGAGARHGGSLGQRLQFAQARADFVAFGLQRRGVARRFFEFGLARRQFLGRVDTGDAGLERAHFGRQLADRQGQRIFLRFQRRQRLLQRFQTLGAAGLAEAVARRFHEQRAAAAAFAVIGVRRDPLGVFRL